MTIWTNHAIFARRSGSDVSATVILTQEMPGCLIENRPQHPGIPNFLGCGDTGDC